MKRVALKALGGLILLTALGAGGYYYFQRDSAAAAPVVGKEGKEIEATGLREFAPDTDTLYTPISSQDKSMYQDILNATKIAGDTTDATKDQQAIGALNKVISQYPTASTAYFLTATLMMAASSTDYQTELTDVNDAIKYYNPNDIAGTSLASIYATKAKIDFELGDYQTVLNDLDTAVQGDLANAEEVFNTGGVKAEDASNQTVLELPDFNTLVAQLPNDYRSYMYRGLFYNSFSFYNTQYYAPAISDLDKAISLNPQSAYPQYFLGEVEEKMELNIYAFTLPNQAAYDSMQSTIESKASEHFNDAISIDPNFKEAYAAIAEVDMDMKDYTDAIPAFNKAIQLDPNNAGLYNDRALAEQSTNDSFDAISDDAKAIQLDDAASSSPTILGDDLIQTLQNQADAYVSMQNYSSAIDDYGRAIGLQFGSDIITFNLPTIRALYPQLGGISDQHVIEGMRQKYDPSMDASDFAATLASNSTPAGSLLDDMYTSRADVYLKAGQYKNAAEDYQRSLTLDSSASTNLLVSERWKDIGTNDGTTYSIDAMTLDFSKTDPTLWLKSTNDDGSYSEQQYEFDCTNQQIKSLSAANYDAYGDAGATQGEQSWQSVIPQTIGETLYDGVCQTS